MRHEDEKLMFGFLILRENFISVTLLFAFCAVFNSLLDPAEQNDEAWKIWSIDSLRSRKLPELLFLRHETILAFLLLFMCSDRELSSCIFYLNSLLKELLEVNFLCCVFLLRAANYFQFTLRSGSEARSGWCDVAMFHMPRDPSLCSYNSHRSNWLISPKYPSILFGHSASFSTLHSRANLCLAALKESLLLLAQVAVFDCPREPRSLRFFMP